MANAEGVYADPQWVNRLRHTPLELIDPPLLLRIEEVDVVNDTGAADHVLLFSVAPSRHAHQRTDGKAFVRAGDSTISIEPYSLAGTRLRPGGRQP